MAKSQTRYSIEAIARDARGRIISRGFNNYNKSHPLQSHFAELAGHPKKQFLHAEILTILRARDKKIYSLEVINHTTSAIPYPCAICQLAVEKFGIKKIIARSMFKSD